MIVSSHTVTQVIEQTAYTLQWLLYPVQIPVLDMDMHGQPMQKHLFQFGLKYFETFRDRRRSWVWVSRLLPWTSWGVSWRSLVWTPSWVSGHRGVPGVWGSLGGSASQGEEVVEEEEHRTEEEVVVGHHIQAVEEEEEEAAVEEDSREQRKE